jgi:hypothetical protein
LLLKQGILPPIRPSLRSGTVPRSSVDLDSNLQIGQIHIALASVDLVSPPDVTEHRAQFCVDPKLKP